MTTLAPWERAARGAMLLGTDGRLAPTIFAEMSALAASTGSINLGQGFPDEDGPEEVLEAARRAITDGVNQYPPGRGMPVLLEAVAAHQKRFYDIDLDPASEVLVTAGATEALAATLLAFVEPGDEVVTLEPFYDSYGAVIGLADGVHRTVALRGDDFEVDEAELRRVITDRTRIILINDPHNPTGSVLSETVATLLVELAHTHDALLVSDEVYEHLLFDGTAHRPIATLPGAAERTVTIPSGGKTFSTTGWKIGWLTAPAELVTRILAVKQFLTFVNGAPFQPAIAIGLALPDSYFDGIAATLQSKRDLLRSGLEAAGLPTSTPRGSYFVISDAAGLGFDDAVDLCRRLPSLAGVVGVPISAFCHAELGREYASLVRFAFCKRFEVLEEAVGRLSRLGR